MTTAVEALLQTRRLDVGGVSSDVTLRYHTQGSGRDVMLLHGFPETLQGWSPLADELGRQARVHAFDWMGMGGSDAPLDFDYSLRGYADLIGRVAQRVEIARMDLVAFDFAVPAALLYALDHAPQVRSLCLIAGPALDRAGLMNWTLRLLAQSPFGDVFLRGMPRTAFWILMQRGFFGEPAIAPDVWEDYHAQVRRPRFREVALQVWRSLSSELVAVERALPSVAAPVLVLWGENDPYVHPRMGRLLADACPKATLRTVSRCGHFVVEEQSAFVLQNVTDFIGSMQ